MTDISTSLPGLPLEAQRHASTDLVARRIVRTVSGLARRRGYGAAARVLARTALDPTASAQWLEMLEWLSSATGVAALPYDLIDKAHRPLPDRRFDAPARIRLLSRHYRLLLTTLGPEAVARLLRGQHLPVAALTGRSGQIYRLNLCRDFRASSQGELVVSFSRAARAEPWLASLSLTAGSPEPDEAPSLWIGALHGQSAHGLHGAVAEATDDLWGLTPRQSVLECTYAMASLLGAEGLKAWPGRERGAQPGPDQAGSFDLPTIRFREDITEASAADRPSLRERGALLDTVIDATLALAALRTRPICQLVDLRWYRLPGSQRVKVT